MGTKHTPGPWVTERDSKFITGNLSYFYVEANDCPVCEISADYITWFNKKEQELEANARLIAAAPEMLEALKAILKENDGVCPDCVYASTWDLMEDAVAKAEGNQ
jgi:hypothetical protein